MIDGRATQLEICSYPDYDNFRVLSEKDIPLRDLQIGVKKPLVVSACPGLLQAVTKCTLTPGLLPVLVAEVYDLMDRDARWVRRQIQTIVPYLAVKEPQNAKGMVLCRSRRVFLYGHVPGKPRSFRFPHFHLMALDVIETDTPGQAYAVVYSSGIS